MGLVIDLFAGGGGASLGLRWALNKDPDIAINHDPEAVAMHKINHPDTQHFCQDVWRVLPQWAAQGRPVDLLWASPDCKHHSKAKGGKPRDKKIRDLAWVVVEWARITKPNLIMLENVEEFRDWGPLDDNGHPIKELKGTTFKAWVDQIRRAGYRVEWRELRACDYGAPTIRKRLFLVARRDGLPIAWPEPTHGPSRPEPWRTAAECIDWSIPCPSIFERSRPLADNTLRRIAAGIKRFVIESREPFIITNTSGHAPSSIGIPLPTLTTGNHHYLATPLITEHANSGQLRTWPAGTPLRTICAETKGGHFALLSPTLIQTGYGERNGQAPRVPGLGKPLGTIMAAGAKHALVTAMLAKHYTGVVGSSLAAPLGTVTSVDHHSLVATHLTKFYGTSIGTSCNEPIHTITAGGQTARPSTGLKMGLVAALLTKYYGQGVGQGLQEPAATVTARDRMGLVTVTICGEPYVIADIGLRMLQPRELFRAQGFPDDYVIGDDPSQGLSLSKTSQVRLCGNSVCPPIAEALVRANACHLLQKEAA